MDIDREALLRTFLAESDEYLRASRGRVRLLSSRWVSPSTISPASRARRYWEADGSRSCWMCRRCSAAQRIRDGMRDKGTTLSQTMNLLPIVETRTPRESLME